MYCWAQHFTRFLHDSRYLNAPLKVLVHTLFEVANRPNA